MSEFLNEQYKSISGEGVEIILNTGVVGVMTQVVSWHIEVKKMKLAGKDFEDSLDSTHRGVAI